MESPNVATYRAGHEAFNERDFVAMTKQYADTITWTDHAQGRAFRTPRGVHGRLPARMGQGLFRHQDHQPSLLSTLARRWHAPSPWPGLMHGPLGPLPATGKEFTLPLCEMWHFDSSGQVVGGDLYYDQVSLLTQLGLMPQPS